MKTAATSVALVAFVAIFAVGPDARAQGQGPQLTVINGSNLFGGPATWQVPASTVVFRVQDQALPMLPHNSSYFYPYRFDVDQRYSGYHALFVSPSEQTVINLRAADPRYNTPNMTMRSDTLANLIARASQAGYQDITIIHDGMFTLDLQNPSYIIIGRPPANPPVRVVTVALPEAVAPPPPIIVLPRRPAIAWGWSDAVRRAFIPSSLSATQAMNLLNLQLGTTVTLASAAWSAQIVIANDAQLRRVALLRRNADQLQADYSRWLSTPAAGLGDGFWGWPDSQHRPDPDVLMAGVGGNYLAYFFSRYEIRAAQLYRETDGAGGQTIAAIFSRLAIEAFHRYYMARFLSETRWTPPFSYVAVDQPGTNHPFSRTPCLTFNYMV